MSGMTPRGTRRRIRTRWLVIGGLVLVGGAQLVPVDRSNPPVRSEVQAPPEVQAILRRACYDCHSHETRWPWYSHVAPVSWLVAHDVHEGRGDLDFSDWPRVDFEAQDLQLADIRKQMEKKKMPLAQYLLLHPDAKLSDADRAAIIAWTRAATR
jgi:hypothetical protein